MSERRTELGTLISEKIPEWSLSSIQDIGTSKVTTYMIGDQVQGAQVVKVERSSVIVINNGRREFIESTTDTTSALSGIEKPTPVNGAQSAMTLGNTIKQITDDVYEIPRAEIDNVLAHLDVLSTQARIMPAFKDGVVQGFKLLLVRPNPLFSTIGIQNGDLIKRLNGFEINSLETALEVYAKIKTSSRVDIEVERNGAAVSKSYNIR